MRDDSRKATELLAYLESERAHTETSLAPARALEDAVFAELRGRLAEDDATVPVLDDGYWYYTRFETGKQHPIHARRHGTMDAPEEVLLDGNLLAQGHDFYAIGAHAVSRDGKLLAWVEDTVGRGQFTLRIKDLISGSTLPDTAFNIAPSIVWANDDRTLFYTGRDPITLREDRVVRHTLGAGDHLVWKEDDAAYYVRVARTKSRRYVQIVVWATTTSEVRLVDAARPTTPPRVFAARRRDHFYELDHLDGRFVVRTNDRGPNFRLAEVVDGGDGDGDAAAWRDLLPHRDDTLIEEAVVYHRFVAASVRTGGLRKVQVVPVGGTPFFLDASDPAFAMTVIDTPDPSAPRVRFAYDALTVPRSIYDLDVATRAPALLKRQPVPGFDGGRYASAYLHATAADGARVPISLVYRKDTRRDGSAPLLIYGYGSYGYSQEPRFSSMAVSLLDRGWVYAIAHVRGGEELGRAWYDDGRLFKKKNTFTDFIAVTEHLIAEGYGARDQVFAMGGSAGGLLMGAIANMRPDLYRGIVALVPFVDVIATMLDESIPLTTNEFDEWGNPKEPAAYAYMRSYSPCDNVARQGYPSIYVRTGLWDSQVQYLEAAKWVARLRALRTDHNLIVLDIDMTSGHVGASGRFDRMRQSARTLAFLLHVRVRADTRPDWPPR